MVEMMRIQVKLFAGLKAYSPANVGDGKFSLDLKEGTRLKDVWVKIGIPDDVARFALINGRSGDAGLSLKEGDVLAVFPPIAGG